MSVIFLLIPLSILIATGFLMAFLWAVTSGQYEDTNTPSLRVLLDEPSRKPISGAAPKSQTKIFTDGKTQKP
jgi:cbb3-type cytochrome oxidase maturation protein